MREIITYNGKDISKDVETIAATHEMYAGGRQADTIELVFLDDEKLWAKWQPVVGDVISYQKGGTPTGKMFVYEPYIDNNLCIIRATSIPGGMSIVRSKSWEQVYLQQIGDEIAKRSGLEFELLGFSNLYYDYMKQDNQTDGGFLRNLAELEGGGITVYDGRLIMFKESYLEEQKEKAIITTTGAQFERIDRTGSLFGSAEVRCGSFFGKFTADKTNGRILKPQRTISCTSNAEAARYAAGILRQANKEKTEAILRSPLMPDVSAGVVVDLNNTIVPSWSGRFFVYKIRHEYHKDKSTTFMRRTLEGY